MSSNKIFSLFLQYCHVRFVFLLISSLLPLFTVFSIVQTSHAYRRKVLPKCNISSTWYVFGLVMVFYSSINKSCYRKKNLKCFPVIFHFNKILSNQDNLKYCLFYYRYRKSLSITILHLTSSLPFKAIDIFLLVDIFKPYLAVIFYYLFAEICNVFSESVTITWSSVNMIVKISLFLKIFMPFMFSWFM